MSARDQRPLPRRDFPPPPGVTRTATGAEVTVYAGHADAVTLCLFDADGGGEQRIPLKERAHGWWFGHIDGMGIGQRYGFRVDGPWDPETGHRHNPAKLLIDPYAHALDGSVHWGPEVFGAEVDQHSWRGEGGFRNDLDSAAFMPKSVVIDEHFDWGDDHSPGHSRSESVIYETHVVNLTKNRPGVPEHLRGTYAGLAHPDTIAYLTDLGVTAVELLPIHAFTHEPRLIQQGLVNHWGYNSLAFLAPHAPYAAASDPQGVVDEVKGMVKLLHQADIEVILDVVYNHTAEQDRTGATLSFRGLDNRAYYRLDERGRDIDVTGCGNTLDLRHPITCQLVLSSLRHWVQEYHVDGFRFDLAVALARGRGDDFDPDHPFLVALRTDPVLSQVKLIAEPWDVGLHGWRTGQFPPPFSEWNDKFRDSVRGVWLSDQRALHHGEGAYGLHDLATRLAGSYDLFGSRGRGPAASVNFVAAHDGFTMADLTTYDAKHNEANAEGNNDGTTNNASWNHGVEGPTDDPDLLARRRRTLRALMGTLLLSAGIPMINAGDEFGRTQGGNNNPYNQDNATSWFDWDFEDWQRDLHATTKHLLTLRRDYPALRQRPGNQGVSTDDAPAELRWFATDGHLMEARWHQPDLRTLSMLIDGSWAAAQSMLVVVNAALHDVDVSLPAPGDITAYQLLWDSGWEAPKAASEWFSPTTTVIAGTTIRVYAARRT